MNALITAPIVVPLVGAVLALGCRKWRHAQRAVALVSLVAMLAASIALLIRVESHGILVTHLGGWAAPVGITLVVDMLSALMLVVSAGTILAVHVFAIGQEGSEGDELSPYFHPVYLILAGGIAAAFTTGDLFNLFVAIEITLAASYVLITLGGRRDQVRTGMTYVVLNLLGSTMFLATIGLVYAATGTVNMADLVGKFDTISPGLRTALGLMMLIAFGIKAAIFPLFSWLPDSYPTAPASVTAVFAGLLTKVGVYAIFRTQAFYFSGDGSPSTLLMVLAGLTMVVGVLGAIAQNDVKRILSFHIVSQIGYMIMGLAFFSIAGLAAAIFFVLHQIPIKTSLFLVSGIVEHSTGTSSLRRLGGLARVVPIVAVAFGLSALSLAGIPPFSGFVGKLSLVQAGFGVREWTVVGVSLAVSLLTLFSMLKIWNGAFWGTPNAALGHTRKVPLAMLAGTAGLVIAGLVIAVAAGPVYSWSEEASATLLDPSRYVQAVLE